MSDFVGIKPTRLDNNRIVPKHERTCASLLSVKGNTKSSVKPTSSDVLSYE